MLLAVSPLPVVMIQGGVYLATQVDAPEIIVEEPVVDVNDEAVKS